MLRQTDPEVLNATWRSTGIEISRLSPKSPGCSITPGIRSSACRGPLWSRCRRLNGRAVRSLALDMLASDTPLPEGVLPLKSDSSKRRQIVIEGLIGEVRRPDYNHRVCRASLTVLEANLSDNMTPALISL